MTQYVYKFLKSYSVDIHKINRIIVSAYIRTNNIMVHNNIMIQGLIITENEEEESNALSQFLQIIDRQSRSISFEDVIRLFEFVISPIEKEVNGAVYTPKYIREYITQQALNRFPQDEWQNLSIADISCGCGGFFVTAVEIIKRSIDISFYDLYQNIYGADIADYSIDRTQILLNLYALSCGEDVAEYDFNLYVANSLGFDWSQNQRYAEIGGFDIIIGNPPYVSSLKISSESKALLENWNVCKTGKPDLYIPFFQIAIELLNNRGVLGYITVSNFYRSLNGRAFRNYMSEHHYSFKIIDFGAEQVFKGRSTYTCICFISREEGDISYVRTNSKDIIDLTTHNFTQISYADLSNKDGWLLQSSDVGNNIRIIESTGIPLSQYCDIKNGFATLKNDVYILDVDDINDENYYYLKSGCKIEKAICRDAIKPNTLKHEDELSAKIEKLLFPYSLNSEVLTIIPEDEFKNSYPYAYAYLLSNKDILAARDKGFREYATWYSFGRSQALTIKGYKLLFPYIADKPYFVIAQDEDLLFYNGYALVSQDMHRINIAKKILQSSIFWYYIKHTSKPYGSEYFALAKNYIKNFGIPSLTSKQEVKLLGMNDKVSIDKFLSEIYGVTI